jgi:hypothetical protein
MSQVDHMVSHSAMEGMEKWLERESPPSDLRRGNTNGGLSRSHNK